MKIINNTSVFCVKQKKKVFCVWVFEVVWVRVHEAICLVNVFTHKMKKNYFFKGKKIILQYLY